MLENQSKHEDNRKTELVYKRAKKEGETLVFQDGAYEVLKKLIPSKEL